MKTEEFNIPMPWGHIAVKAWGNSCDKPILVTHGRMDNAGAFDKLIPLLAPSFYYICVDLPSHGRSSHLPGFMPIHSMDFVMVYKLILDYFNRGKYILLGHSYGAGIGQYIARFYPQYIEKIIGIDFLVLRCIEPHEFKQIAVQRFNALIAIAQQAKTGQKSSYTEEEAIEKIRKTRLSGDLSVDAARCITNRLLEPAAKTWGSKDNKPVIAIHGGSDNAGAFNKLIPLLPESFYYIAIDVPGHGKSSPLPDFFPIYVTNLVLIILLVLDYIKRNKYIILGHSYGAAIGQYLVRLYPERFEKIIAIDCIAPVPVPTKDFKKFICNMFDGTLKLYEESKFAERKTYTKGEAIEIIRNMRIIEPLPIEAAEMLAERGLTHVGNDRYVINVDLRLRFTMIPLHDVDYQKESFRQHPITCPYLLILAKKTHPKLSASYPSLEVIQQWPKATVKTLDGGHDMLMTNPELLVPHIRDFLLKDESKL